MANERDAGFENLRPCRDLFHALNAIGNTVSAADSAAETGVPARRSIPHVAESRPAIGGCILLISAMFPSRETLLPILFHRERPVILSRESRLSFRGIRAACAMSQPERGLRRRGAGGFLPRYGDLGNDAFGACSLPGKFRRTSDGRDSVRAHKFFKDFAGLGLSEGRRHGRRPDQCFK